MAKTKRLTKEGRLEKKRLEREARRDEILAMEDEKLNAGFFKMTGISELTQVAFAELEKSARVDAFLRMEEKDKK